MEDLCSPIVVHRHRKIYVKKVIKTLKQNTNNKLLLNTKITSITSKREKVNIEYNQNNETFDKVIMATHPNQTLKLIKNLDKKTTLHWHKLKGK